jgi:hypothetical protein
MTCVFNLDDLLSDQKWMLQTLASRTVQGDEVAKSRRLEDEVKRARLDERQAMTHLSQVRIAAEHDGDFPSLAERVKQMAEALRAAHEMTKAARGE